ncbi:MAG: hypothetical protein J1F18_15685 [Lachnospiraceae bacterium]|nr:hypothetical protein [Lachnospiraceae bacterium]
MVTEHPLNYEAIKNGLSRDYQEIIKNAIKQAEKEWQEMVVYKDSEGLWYGPNYPGRVSFSEEKIMGYVRIIWTLGTPIAQYVPVQT